MMDYDLTVTWRLGDGKTIDLPATVAFSENEDTIERRTEAASLAIEHNTVDFPDDLDEGSVPINVRFSDA